MIKLENLSFENELTLVLCGEAGQGVQTIEFLLSKILKASGYHIFATKEYESRVRGGALSTEIRISNKRVNAYVHNIDLLIALTPNTFPHLTPRISPRTIIIGDKEKLNTDCNVIDIPLSRLAAQVGGAIYENTIALALICGLLGLSFEDSSSHVKEFFKEKDENTVHKNIEALQIGYDNGVELANKKVLVSSITRTTQSGDEVLLNGSEAITFGALAGGCNFVCSYPMSPSTGVFHLMAQLSKDHNVIVEQVEDEIAGVNMALGAWYAGGRAMVSTSGGGFALMCEGMSLAGVMELPLVIHLAQRPGPATGLPTRTEQGDLNLALYAGHGDFPRILLAPGTVEEAFLLSKKAFELAEKFQVPVILLSDQYLVDSFYNVPFKRFAIKPVNSERIKAGYDYIRYTFTPDGLSPRGIPGSGEGLVVADSHEHDEKGHITEDETLRTRMVEKRLKKLQLLEKEAQHPVMEGPRDYEYLVIGWGSTYHSIKEALERLKVKHTAQIHFNQPYPISPTASEALKKAKTLICIENNATGQFADVLKLYMSISIHHRILKYSGAPYSVEELEEKLKPLVD